jgi:hypothetical protein
MASPSAVNRLRGEGQCHREENRNDELFVGAHFICIPDVKKRPQSRRAEGPSKCGRSGGEIRWPNKKPERGLFLICAAVIRRADVAGGAANHSGSLVVPDLRRLLLGLRGVAYRLGEHLPQLGFALRWHARLKRCCAGHVFTQISRTRDTTTQRTADLWVPLGPTRTASRPLPVTPSASDPALPYN